MEECAGTGLPALLFYAPSSSSFCPLHLVFVLPAQAGDHFSLLLRYYYVSPRCHKHTLELWSTCRKNSAKSVKIPGDTWILKTGPGWSLGCNGKKDLIRLWVREQCWYHTNAPHQTELLILSLYWNCIHDPFIPQQCTPHPAPASIPWNRHGKASPPGC